MEYSRILEKSFSSVLIEVYLKMVSIDEFRQLALAFPETKELEHWGRPSFRVRGKIFSTLWPEQGLAMVKLSQADQSVYVSFDPNIFYPVPGGWGRKGATFVQLKKVKKSMLKEALGNAWAKLAPKSLLKNPAQSVKENPRWMQTDALLFMDRLRDILLALPGVTEGICYGTPGFYVNKKFLARLKEDGETLVVRTGDRENWMDTDPEIFFITDHYLNYPAVLVRLTKVRQKDLQKLLLDAWHERAGNRSEKEWSEKWFRKNN